MSESRKIKRKLEFPNEENNKTKAVFSEEDDISLLKAMIDYEVSKQANPYDDMGNFLAFVKPFLSFDIQRRQLTNRLWRLRNKYVNSDYDISKPHHAKLLELSKSIKSWGCHAKMSLDGDNVVNGDGQNVRGDNVVVGKSSKVVESKGKGKLVENKGKGKVVTCGGRSVEQDNVAIGDADVLNEGLNVGKKERKHLSKDGQTVVNSDGQNVRGDKVVVGDIDVGKSSKVVENKGKGKVVTCDGRNVEQDNVGIGDADVLNDGLKVGKKKRKHLSSDGQIVASCDGQNVRGHNVVVGDIDVGKSSKVVENKGKGKVVENKGKGKVVTCNGRNVEQDNVAIGDADVLNEGLNVGKKERKHLSKDGQTVVNSDGQNVRGDKVVVGDIDVGKSSKVVKNKGKGKAVKNKGKGKVVTCDGRNVEQDNVEVNINDLKAMFPELTNMLELETLSKMPQHLKKKCVRDTIDSMGWEKANELEEEWADVRLMEMALKAKKLELTSKQMNLILILEAMHA